MPTATASSFAACTTISAELMIHLVQNLTIDSASITAQTISRSNVFDNDDELGELWDMLHFSTKDEIAADVRTVLTEIDKDLAFLL